MNNIKIIHRHNYVLMIKLNIHTLMITVILLSLFIIIIIIIIIITIFIIIIIIKHFMNSEQNVALRMLKNIINFFKKKLIKM